MKIFGYIVAGLLLLAVISASVFALRVILLPARVATGTLNTVEGVVDKTLTADNAIYNYEWFKRQYEAIQAIQKKITIAHDNVIAFEASAGARKNWTFEDKNEASRLASIEQGLRSQNEDMVAEYNARSKMANRNIFKDGLIPSTLEVGSDLLK